MSDTCNNSLSSLARASLGFLAATSLVVSCTWRSEYDLSRDSSARSADSPSTKFERPWRDSLGELIFPLIEEDDTRYAAGYAEHVFLSLEIGTSKEQVRRRLGLPLSTKTFDGDYECWYYSEAGRLYKSYFVRVLKFDMQGTLIGRYQSFYLDW